MGAVEEVGEVLWLDVAELDEAVDEEETERLRVSSARMSERETLRWGCEIGMSVRFSTKREAILKICMYSDAVLVSRLVFVSKYCCE